MSGYYCVYGNDYGAVATDYGVLIDYDRATAKHYKCGVQNTVLKHNART